jgi:hypothetical protein
MKMICPECGQAFDGNQCPVCVARNKAFIKTLHRPFQVALLGLIGTVFAFFTYHPLGSPSWVVSVVAALVGVPLVTAVALDKFHRLTRYATLVRTMMVFAAATLVLLASYFYLNGSLDGNPSVEAEGIVSQKFLKSGKYGPSYYLTVTISWNGERFEDDDLSVGHATYSVSEAGDSVRVIVHPGEFSLPWYSAVLPSGSRESISR